jgi:cytochrome c nitrite reductase small subunit
MSAKWALFIGIACLVLALGLFTWVSDAPAYMGHAPQTCNNCHVMDSQYENWFHAPHREWADCTECHIPHDNIAAYWFYKGKSGLKDVYSFVTHSYPVAIRANPETIAIVQQNCIRCHLDTVESMLASGGQPFERSCWECHRQVAHGSRGLSLYPYQDSEVYNR